MPFVTHKIDHYSNQSRNKISIHSTINQMNSTFEKFIIVKIISNFLPPTRKEKNNNLFMGVLFNLDYSLVKKTPQNNFSRQCRKQLLICLLESSRHIMDLRTNILKGTSIQYELLRFFKGIIFFLPTEISTHSSSLSGHCMV